VAEEAPQEEEEVHQVAEEDPLVEEALQPEEHNLNNQLKRQHQRLKQEAMVR
jgi:hypothetical protein